jgi:phosphoserine phosphatase
LLTNSFDSDRNDLTKYAKRSPLNKLEKMIVEAIATITPKNLLSGALDLLIELRQAGIKIAIWVT